MPIICLFYTFFLLTPKLSHLFPFAKVGLHVLMHSMFSWSYVFVIFEAFTIIQFVSVIFAWCSLQLSCMTQSCHMDQINFMTVNFQLVLKHFSHCLSCVPYNKFESKKFEMGSSDRELWLQTFLFLSLHDNVSFLSAFVITFSSSWKKCWVWILRGNIPELLVYLVPLVVA